MTSEDIPTQKIIEEQEEQIDGVSLSVLRELEEKLKSRELAREQEILNSKDKKLLGLTAPEVDYYRSGRGLIYNCLDKHWACVDEAAFFECRQAQKINEANKQVSSCLIYEVYLTDQECQRAQYLAMTDEEKGEKACR